MTDTDARRAQLHAIARTYVTEGLGKRNFDAIPYNDNVNLRAPDCLGGMDASLSIKTALDEIWWTPLSQRMGALGDSYAPNFSCRYRVNTCGNVPLYFAQRSANI